LKEFIATPEEFATGASASKAVDVYRHRNWKNWPRKRNPSVPPLPKQDLKMGTITPEQFGTGEPWFGYRNRRARHAHLPNVMKPLPESYAIVARLLQ